MSGRLLLLIGFVLGLLTFASAAQAERRVALVVGNSAYTHAAALRNPRNDARDIAETLKRLDFDVLVGLDLDQQNFATIIQKFVRMLDDADVALFFYAGHGLQINGKNYLVSTNAKLENEFLIPAETIELDTLIRLMEAKAPIDLVFLDACRNNPLTDQLKRSLTAMKRGGDLGRGLARIEPTGRDTLIAFAAAPGQEAADGANHNSPFTGALLKYMPQPGLEVSVMLKEVAAQVRRETRNTQRPQQLSDMTRTFYFAKAQPVVAVAPAPPPPVVMAPPPPRPELEVAYWNSVRSLQDCNAVQAYVRRFPNGTFIELARLDEERLCNKGRRLTVVDGPPASSSATPASSSSPPAGTTVTIAAAKPALPKGDLVVPPLVGGVMKPGIVVAGLNDAAKELSMTDVIRNVQLELIRLGCASGEADGKWGAPGREAILRFNKSTGANLVADAPSTGMVTTLKTHKERVCQAAKPAPRKARNSRQSQQ
jgi:hypothetical protein